ncbi:hypothetical protein A2783_02180 [Microgenomates group bacterium RIFCSPHIGHO2_01_FULL_45_11]|nr:MAG: hypothetical protein A2783_02180 [Microgenomates group bacterium RIFCSPHIGHO2_01_FULL_45_11]
MSIKLKDILGLNARNHEYLSRYNSAGAKRIADSKLLTKSTLQKHELPVPKLYRVFRKESDLDKFDFTRLPESFVVKPNKGLGGEGIIVVEKPGTFAGEWITAQGDTIKINDLKLHILDILAGRFSMDNLRDFAFIEERIRIHPAFAKYAYHGTPDIGILVFNKVPVMAFLRLPTKESGGRANMFQGAIACGIDVAAGATTYAAYYYSYVTYYPGTRRRLRGLTIPEWDLVLDIAIRAAAAVGLGYMRADIVLQPSLKHPGKTLPKVLEVNAQPGLKIQLANRAGLKRRLERVEGLEIDTQEKGIKVAKALFADRSLAHLGKTLKPVTVFETVEVVNQLGEKVAIKAKVDTGAYRTSIDKNLAEKLGLLRTDNILLHKQFESALGAHTRDVIAISYYLNGRKIDTTASVIDRSNLKRPMLVGRQDLKGFVIEFSQKI